MAGYPAANRTAQWFYDTVGGANMGSVEKVVWHTTETTGWPAYDGGSKAPHYTVKPNYSTQVMEWRQHFPDSVNSRALQNDPGGVQTNLDGALQVEIVGTCDEDRSWPASALRSWDLEAWQSQGLAEFAAWCYTQHGVPLTARSPFRAYSNATGVARENNGIRMSGAAWDGFRGQCGHQHVPENDHGDPGALPMPAILAAAHDILFPPEAAMSLPAIMVASGQTQQYLVDGNVKRKIVTGAVSNFLTDTVDLPLYTGVPSAVLSLWPTVAVDASGVGQDAASQCLAQLATIAAQLAALAEDVATADNAPQIAALAQQVVDVAVAVADDPTAAQVDEVKTLVESLLPTP